MKTSRDITLDAASGTSIAYDPILTRLGRKMSDCIQIKISASRRKMLVACIFVALPFSASTSEVQISNNSPYSVLPAPGSSNQSPFPDPFHGMDDISRQQFQKQLKALNAERQKQISSDSVKLLALATELKAEVDRAGTSDPTPEQLRKAEQIEKLAHNVRDKMKSADTPAEPMAPIRRK